MKGSRPAVDDGKEKRCCDAIMIGYNGPRTPDRLWSTYRNTPPARKSPFPSPRYHRKVDDFDQAFATCPTKLTCALFLLPPFSLFFSLSLPHHRYSKRTNLSKKDEHFFFSRVSISFELNVD